MSVHQETFQQLVDMGIEAPLARAAAIRFSNGDAAVNWCFGEGSDWKPEDEAPKPAQQPKVDPTEEPNGLLSPHTVKHTEVMSSSNSSTSSFSTLTKPSPTPPRHPETLPAPTPAPASQVPRRLPEPFASNNPFAQSSTPSTAPSPARTLQDDDENDPELQGALQMSTENETRTERERSVRASGVPPPSPESEEGQVMETLFGPSEKDDKEGKLAMVPAYPDKPTTTNNQEDDDFNRAIAESMMTASFHSASAQPQEPYEQPIPGMRADGAPCVLYSESGNSTYAAHLLQGILAIPQVREGLTASILPHIPNASDYLRMTYIQNLAEQMWSDRRSFVLVDQTLKELRRAQEPAQLPPATPTLQFQDQLQPLVQDMLVATRDGGTINREKAKDDYWSDPTGLFVSHLVSDVTKTASFVQLNRHANCPLDLCSALAAVVWPPDKSEALASLSDVLVIQLNWQWGAARESWNLEERVVLDRFMLENQERSAQLRAQQGLAFGNARRIKEKIDSLTYHQGQSVHDNLKTLIKHYELSSVGEDRMREQSRSEMKVKLQSIHDVLKARTDGLLEELTREEKAGSSAVFETDDPEQNKHIYLLRAVMFHDGALVAGKHLYMYLRSDEGKWWKILEHEANPVDFEAIAQDRTGLFMDGGPYFLLYSREGPRPKPTPKTAEPALGTDSSASGIESHEESGEGVPKSQLDVEGRVETRDLIDLGGMGL